MSFVNAQADFTVDEKANLVGKDGKVVIARSMDQARELVKQLDGATVAALYSGLSKRKSLTMAQKMLFIAVDAAFKQQRSQKSLTKVEEKLVAVGEATYVPSDKLAGELKARMSTVVNSKPDIPTGTLVAEVSKMSTTFLAMETPKVDGKVFSRSNFLPMSVVKDNVAQNLMRDSIIKRKTLTYRALSVIQGACGFEMSNGTRLAAVERLKKYLPKNRFDPPMKWLEEELPLVWESLPLDPAVKVPWEYDIDEEMPITDTSAGFPYCIADPSAKWNEDEVLLKSRDDAYHVLTILKTEGLSGVVRDMNARPLFYTCILKPKMEKLLVSKRYEKTRLYWVTPAWYRVLMYPLFNYLQTALQSYSDNPLSVSAYKHSWMYGGAKRLAQHMCAVRQNVDVDAPAGRGVVYGDDASLFLCTPKGWIFEWAPDVSSMDLQFSYGMGLVWHNWFRSQLANMAEDSRWWENPKLRLLDDVAKLAVLFSTRGPAHIDGPLFCSLAGTSLKSGAHGVSLFEIIASGIAVHYVRKWWETEDFAAKLDAVESEEEKLKLFKTFKNEANDRLRGLVGFRYKDEDDVALHRPEDPPQLKKPFLGYSTATEKVTYRDANGSSTVVEATYPVARDPDKILASLWLPHTRIEDSMEAARNRKERLIGVYISALGVDKDFAPILRGMWPALHSVAPGEAHPDSIPEVDQSVVEQVNSLGALPTSAYLKLMYSLPQETLTADVEMDSCLDVDIPGVEVVQAAQVETGSFEDDFDQLTVQSRPAPRPIAPRVKPSEVPAPEYPVIALKNIGGELPKPKKKKLDALRAARTASNKVFAKITVRAKNAKERQRLKEEWDEVVHDGSREDIERLLDSLAPQEEEYDRAVMASYKFLKAKVEYGRAKGVGGRDLQEMVEQLGIFEEMLDDMGALYE